MASSSFDIFKRKKLILMTIACLSISSFRAKPLQHSEGTERGNIENLMTESDLSTATVAAENLRGESGVPEEELVAVDKRVLSNRGSSFAMGSWRSFSSNYGTYPFRGVAYLSVGCTGTFITPMHVLTAAHCVHERSRFRPATHGMHVVANDAMGQHQVATRSVSVLSAWTTSISTIDMLKNDVAIVTLVRPAPIRRAMPLFWGENLFDKPLSFLAYGLGGRGAISMTTCPPWGAYKGVLLVSAAGCIVERGNSGAAMYTHIGGRGERIVGVLSTLVGTGRYGVMVAITRLTEPLLKMFCPLLSDDLPDLDCSQANGRGIITKQT